MINKLNIAICDDDETALIAIRGTLAGILEKMKVQAVIDTYMSSALLQKAMDDANYNIVFLDIEMPQIDGIKLGRNIKDNKSGVDIIYISNREDLVFETFKIHPFGFVRKSRFIKDISEVMRLYLDTHNSAAADTVTFKYHNSEISLCGNDIIYIESARDYQYIYVNGRKEPIKLHESMDALMLRLEPLGFIRIHKGYIVNFRYIRRIDTTAVTLTTDAQLPLARRSVDSARAKYMQLCRSSGAVRLN